MTKKKTKPRAAAKKNDIEERRHLVGFLIHDVSRMRMRYFDTVFKAMGFTRIHWWTLGNIRRIAGDGISQGELAKVMGVKKAMMGIMMDQLEDAGLVQRVSEPNDRRIRIIKITERGAAFSDNLMQTVRDMSPQFNKNISVKDLDITVRTLEKMTANAHQALAEQGTVKAPARRKNASDGIVQGRT